MIAQVATRIEEIRGQLGLSTRPSPSSASPSSASPSSASPSLTPTWPTSPSSTPTSPTSPGNTNFASSLTRAIDHTQNSTVTGTDIVADARRYLGVPYVFGGTNPATGLDCSGLVMRVYADLGITLPRIADQQARAGQPVPSLDQAKPGDLLAFNSPVDHIAIYMGNGKMIAAPQPGEVVKIQDVYKTPSAIRRIVGTQETTTVTTSPWSAPIIRPSSLPPVNNASTSVPYASLFQNAARQYGLSPTLLAAVAKVESNYNPTAVSRAGAQGLMQIMPSTAQGLGVDPLDPAQAVDGAARLLVSNLKQFNGSLPLALAAYNAGAGAVRTYGGIPPYAETKAYVPKVQAAMAELTARGFG